MVNLDIVEEKALSFNDLKDALSEVEKRDKELSIRAKKVQEYLGLFKGLKPKEEAELRKKIAELEIPRLKEKHIIKIINILPQDLESLRIIFVGENITIKTEDMKRIFDVIKEFI